ncbi:exodeoxyribonuclease V subunit beta [Rheinheimera sp. UJ63]|uniref:exodeoxyribonuclease V subunit beta n=1 Tax=Rheinheimera sp. UJ63 TaxID=2910157 RepID=UPI001F31E7D5|nr:exodeoxyribonuclease V subunit beta [Rheinheimera sp. UJ63]MCF4010657.1 exodeoxyribonuclease V subunit beta [Rheinheimera sp. UJ63]
MSNAKPVYLAVSLQGKNLLEASAGTGKTFTVALLYLRALLGVGTPNNKPLAVEEILVVTFTNAATEELIERIRLRIKEAIAYLDEKSNDAALGNVLGAALDLHQDNKDYCRDLLKTALSHISFANISTIHSFCADLCKSIAIDSGLPIAITLSTDDEIINESIMDVWRENVAQGDSYYQSLIDNSAKHKKVYKKILSSQVASLTAPQDSLLKQSFFDTRPERAELVQFFNKYSVVYNAPYNNDAKVSQALNDLYAVDVEHTQIAPTTLKFFAASKLGSQEVVRARADAALLGELKVEVVNNAFFKLCDNFNATKKRSIPLVDYQFFYKSTQSVLSRLKKTEANTGNIYSDRLIQLAAEVSKDPRVSELIRKKLPLAIIDEFQDTDPFQYRLFNNIYSGKDNGLLMVGDPKQAIYAFRGGDIYTYLRAKKDADKTYNLDTNNRSADTLVAGMKAIFEQPLREGHKRFTQGVFNQAQIKYTDVKARDDKPLLMVGHEGKLKPLEAIAGEYIADNADCSLNSAARQRITAENAASYIHKLLSLADKAQCLYSEDSDVTKIRALKPSDIALLVNSHSEAKLLKTALLNLGIASLTQSKESIYQAPEAYDIWLILRAILDPKNARYFEAALLAEVNGLGYCKVYEVINNEVVLQQWIAKFQELNELFLSLGPLVALTRWFNLIGATQSLMKLENDRKATNVTQLLELLQEDYVLFGGGLKLLGRFEQAIAAEDTSDESLIRLESDEDRVKIITIHASKGLEYPVVIVPFAWRDSVQVRDSLYSAHDTQGKALFGFCEEIKSAQKQELLDEKLRLFYVALTRASRHLVLFFIDAQEPTKNTPSSAYNKSPLAWYFPTASDADSVSCAHSNFVTALSQANAGCVSLKDCPVVNVVKDCALDESLDYEKVGKLFSDQIDQRMGTSSFSMLSRGYSVVLKDDDELQPTAEDTNNSAQDRHLLARGANIGNALHNVLEYTDFTKWCGAISEETLGNLTQLMLHELKANGVILKNEMLESELPKYTQWMREVILTPFLDMGSNNVALAHLKEWRSELSFTFALSPSFSKSGLHNKLGDLGYHLAELKGPSIYGMLTGSIDLVFCHGGKYYLADYKSNHLGDDFDAYTAAALAQNNDQKAYTLQYLIYCLALHLHLSERIPDYNYEDHFGGVFYLYMRGMHPDHEGKGVFFHLPEERVIDQLANYFLPKNYADMAGRI